MQTTTTLRLIYIHGFQGDHTSFQSFPTDLHAHLLPRLPPHLALQSILYPTYKSRRPVSDAARNFIAWLRTQPPGPVILLAHSMGGLLAAEVATSDEEEARQRVVGLVCFDVPFLGMHPHVIVSGIASLLPKDGEEGVKTELEMNDAGVVESVDSDDVESAKGLDIDTTTHSLRPPLSHSTSSFSSQVSDEWEAMKATTRSSKSESESKSKSKSEGSPSPSLSPSPSSSLISSLTSTSSSYILSRIPPLSSSLPAKLERIMTTTVSQHAPDPLLRWLHKHADDPLSALTRWVVEHFEFGVCMFDPKGLGERYRMLERWERGEWVNFWTEVPKRGGEREREKQKEEEEGREMNAIPDNTADVARFADSSSSSADAKARKAAEKALRKQRAQERSGKRNSSSSSSSSARPARHFIVLPHTSNSPSDSLHFGSRERWARVEIGGVEDEVEAHCGLFIKGRNMEYDGLVVRVGEFVERVCVGL